MKNEQSMPEGDIGELWQKMRLPVILVMMAAVLYNLADVCFIGFGSCAACSIALGEGREELVRKYSAFALYASLLLCCSRSRQVASQTYLPIAKAGGC